MVDKPIFQPEFKVKLDKDNKLTVFAKAERKSDGSLIMHVPSMPLISKAVKEFKEKNK